MISKQLLATVFAFTSFAAFAGAEDAVVDVAALKNAKAAVEKGEFSNIDANKLSKEVFDKIATYEALTKNVDADQKAIDAAKADVIKAIDADIKANTPSFFAKIKGATSTGFNYLPAKIASKSWSQALFVYGSVAAATWYAFGDSIKALFADEEAETEA